MPLGAAPMTYLLWTRYLRHNPSNPNWRNRDRFVLSAGHGSMLLYSLLHLTGYDLTIDDLKNFRQWGSKTPGHPEVKHTPGVETTTGPLGQGFATGIGMAIAQRYLAARYNKPGVPLLDYRIFGIVSDGDLMEGVSSESASLAGHLGLGNIIYLYDDNQISIDGSTELTFTENRMKRFEAYNWHTQSVADGNDLDAIDDAIQNAIKETDRPSIISIKTVIGYGSPNKQNTAESHGSPLGEAEVKLTKKNLGLDPEKQFYIPDEVRKHFQSAIEAGKRLESEWTAMFAEYKKQFPALADELSMLWNNTLPAEWERSIPTFTTDKTMATREASGKVLNAIAPTLPTLLGGSADLAPSNNTYLSDFQDFQKENYAGRNLRFGVREHAMGSILNGMALTDGIIPYGGTFLVFADYMRPAIRLAALMGTRVIYVFTHDSIGLGEDGPTHQPIEHLASLRAIPNMIVIRPADANETAEAWRFAIQYKKGPVALVLTRQKLPVIDSSNLKMSQSVSRGAYILHRGSDNPDIILIATGSEVHLALSTAGKLSNSNISCRVVSMPSWELFEQQPKEYKESVLPPSSLKRIAIETGVTMGWEKYVGDHGIVIGISRFGASAPADLLMKEFGFTPENIVEKAKNLLGI